MKNFFIVCMVAGILLTLTCCKNQKSVDPHLLENDVWLLQERDDHSDVCDDMTLVFFNGEGWANRKPVWIMESLQFELLPSGNLKISSKNGKKVNNMGYYPTGVYKKIPKEQEKLHVVKCRVSNMPSSLKISNEKFQEMLQKEQSTDDFFKSIKKTR